MHSGPFGCLTKLGAKRAELVQKFVPRSCVGFSATNAPDPPHWTLNSRLGAFCTILVHSGPFGCLTKLGAKRAELVQKFVKRSRIGFFRNERTRSTPIGPKTDNLLRFILFGCIRGHLVAYKTRCETGRSSAKVRATKSHWNFS